MSGKLDKKSWSAVATSLNALNAQMSATKVEPQVQEQAAETESIRGAFLHRLQLSSALDRSIE